MPPIVSLFFPKGDWALIFRGGVGGGPAAGLISGVGGCGYSHFQISDLRARLAGRRLFAFSNIRFARAAIAGAHLRADCWPALTLPALICAQSAALAGRFARGLLLRARFFRQKDKGKNRWLFPALPDLSGWRLLCLTLAAGRWPHCWRWLACWLTFAGIAGADLTGWLWPVMRLHCARNAGALFCNPYAIALRNQRRGWRYLTGGAGVLAGAGLA